MDERVWEVAQTILDPQGRRMSKSKGTGVDPLASAGKLGALLAQFPASFKDRPESRDYLAQLLRAFGDYCPHVPLESIPFLLGLNLGVAKDFSGLDVRGPVADWIERQRWLATSIATNR